MRDPQDLARELEKVLDTLGAVREHLVHKDQMNAALHMSRTVRLTPLAAAVSTSYQNLDELIKELRADARAKRAVEQNSLEQMDY